MTFPLFDIGNYTLPSGDTFGGGGFGQIFIGVDNFFQVTEGLTLVRNRHTLKFGGEMRKQQWNVNDQQIFSGSFGFAAGQTGLPGVTSGDAFASFVSVR